jgi:hypothetical protein
MGDQSIRKEASRWRRASYQNDAELLNSGSACLSPVDEQLLQRVWAVADGENRADVLESFRDGVILRTVRNHSLSAAKAWKCLRESIDSHQEIRELEYNMDHAAFYDCLSSGYFGLSGADARGRPILWMKTFQNQSMMKKGSPLACAYIRAIIYMVEVVHLKTFRGTCDTLIIVNDSQRKAMDLNVAVWQDIFRIFSAVFPMRTEEVWICGMSLAGRTLFKVFNSLLGDRLQNWHFMDSNEKALQVVSDSKEIPEWWTSESSTKTFDVNYNSHWEWERCLARGEETLTRKEILNPTDPWRFIDNDRLSSLESSLCSLDSSPTNGASPTISGIDRCIAFHSRSLRGSTGRIMLDTIAEEDSESADTPPVGDC